MYLNTAFETLYDFAMFPFITEYNAIHCKLFENLQSKHCLVELVHTLLTNISPFTCFQDILVRLTSFLKRIIVFVVKEKKPISIYLDR